MAVNALSTDPLAMNINLRSHHLFGERPAAFEAELRPAFWFVQRVPILFHIVSQTPFSKDGEILQSHS